MPSAPARRPPIRALLFLLALSLLLATFILELGLRLRQRRSDFIFTRKPGLLYAYRPGAHRQHVLSPEDGGTTLDVTINAEGFRGPTTDPSRPRITLHGDSSLAAEYCPWERSFAPTLEAALQHDGYPHQVLNRGVSGYGPDQEYLQMLREPRSSPPNLLLVALTEWNDAGDLVRNQVLSLDPAGALAVRNPPFARPLADLFAATDPSTPSLVLHYAGRLLARLRPNDAPAPAAAPPGRPPAPSEFFEQFLPARLAEFAEYQSPRPLVRNLFGDTIDSDVALDPGSESALTKGRLLTAVLRAMKSHAASNGVPIAFITIPSPFDLDPAPYTPGHASRHPKYQPGALSRFYEEILREVGAPTLHLKDAFSRRSRAEMFLPTDGHWSPAGQKLAAETVARWIREVPLLPSPSARPPARSEPSIR